MAEPRDKNESNNIAYLMVAVVTLAIIIISILTITAILTGPPIV